MLNQNLSFAWCKDLIWYEQVLPDTGFRYFRSKDVRRQGACMSFLIHIATDPFVRKELRHTSRIFYSTKEGLSLLSMTSPVETVL